MGVGVYFNSYPFGRQNDEIFAEICHTVTLLDGGSIAGGYLDLYRTKITYGNHHLCGDPGMVCLGVPMTQKHCQTNCNGDIKCKYISMEFGDESDVYGQKCCKHMCKANGSCF